MNKRQSPIVFYKMHGLGNDFMVIDAVTQTAHFGAEDITRWGDRHTGVGFDQLLVIEPPTTPDADFYYRIYNSDGSSAEQCGNGTRCVAMLAHQLGLSKKPTLQWESAAGLLRTHFTNPQQVETTMTVPELEPAKIPFSVEHASQIEVTDETGSSSLPHYFCIEADDVEYEITPVSMGNPHGVMFLEDIFNVDVPTIGAKLTNHPAFPSGANIGFCQVIDQHFIRLRVFERGAGETRACGSGACAAVVAARLRNLVGNRVKVSLPGGKLRITWPEPDSPVTMAGAAALVYRGEVNT